MRPGQTVTTSDGQHHTYVESWSPDGLTGPTHNPRAPRRRVRYTFVNTATGQRWTTYDTAAFTVVRQVS